MTGCMKRIFLWTEKWRPAVNCLCCALLISLFAATNPVGAAPLTHDGPPVDLSDPGNHRWLAFQYNWAPPEGATETQKTEWAIGFHTAMAEVCGYYGKAAEVRVIMKKSPYFMKGYKIIADIADKITPGKCGQRLSTLKEMLGQKEDWKYYLGATYPDGAKLSEPAKGLSTEE